MNEGMLCKDFIDLGNVSTAAIAITALASISPNLVIAIIDTVKYFGKYGTTLPPSVILTLILRYIFLLVIFIAMHFLLCLIRNSGVRMATEEEAVSSKDDETCAPESEGEEDKI